MPSFREQMKGFPLWQMTVICIIRFSEPIAFTSLFPYVYFMIRDFHIVDDPAKISKYTGYMGASFAFAQFLCCIHWGRLSDRIGRKPVLLLGLLGTATSLLIFGFSTNFYMAITARTLMGALNGNIAVLQTMVGEVVKERICTHFLVRRDALDSARRGAVAWRRNRALVSTKFASWFPLAIDPGH